jgi:hypothetical protein
MKNLDNVTIVCLNGGNPTLGAKALIHSMKDINFGRAILFSPFAPEPLTDKLFNKIEYIPIKKLTHQGSSWFALTQFPEYVKTDFCLSIHDDGFVINPHLWTDEFLDYDYIGAPWANGYVGNGGFVLKSKLFMELAKTMPWNGEHDDWHACVTHQNYFLSNGCKFAPLEVALKFSLEGVVPGYEYDLNNCFGFHGRGTVEYLFQGKGQQFKDRIKLLDAIN